MKKFRIWVFLASVACFLVLAQASKASPQAKEKTHVMSAEVVSVDINAKTITFKDEKGETKTVTVLDKALKSLKTLKGGEKVNLTCLDTEKGEHKGINAIKVVKEKKPEEKK